MGPGSLVGRYRLVRELGRGAMGLVFLADDTVLKQQLCVKVLDPRLVHNPEALERFHREIVLARRIAHRSVCRLHDLHQEGGLHFITMEYVEGTTLRDLLTSDRPLLPVGRVTAIVRNICDALAAAHDVNVVHRDLKPANVMVCAGDEINLLDFGIATADDLRSSLTLPGVAIGTRNYIAPEVWAGRPATARSDQFSLGVLFYNCLTRQRPFPTDKQMVDIEAMKAAPVPPSQLRPEVPRALDAVVLRALAFSPADRFPDVRALAAAIAEVEQREGLTGLPAAGFAPASDDAAQVVTAPRGVSPPGAAAGGPSGEPTIPPALIEPPPTLPALPAMPAMNVVTTTDPTGLSNMSRTDPLLPRPAVAPRVVAALAVVGAVALAVLLLWRDDAPPAPPADARVDAQADAPAVDAARGAAHGEQIREAHRVEPTAPAVEIDDADLAALGADAGPVRAPRVERPAPDRGERESKRVADARAATQRVMTERGVLAGDDAELDRLRARAAAEAKARHIDEAAALEGDARRRVDAVVIDKAFVKKKLVRFNTRFDELRASDQAARARLDAVSTEVLTAMREGRYQDANRALNSAFAALAGRR